MKIFKMLMLGALALTSVTNGYCSSDIDNESMLKQKCIYTVDYIDAPQRLNIPEAKIAMCCTKGTDEKDNHYSFEYECSIPESTVSLTHSFQDSDLLPSIGVATVEIRTGSVILIFDMECKPKRNIGFTFTEKCDSAITVSRPAVFYPSCNFWQDTSRRNLRGNVFYELMMGGVSNVSTISERHIPPETMIKKIVRIAKDKDLTREEDCVKIVSEVMERGYIRFKLYTIETKELEMIAAEIGIGGNWIVNKIT